jgi:ABC-2 type transport system ATP-binding protein
LPLGARRLRETAQVDAARLDQVTVSYGDRSGSARGLAGLDLTVRPGRVTALIGPNGAGKSTTVAVLTGLIPPDEGDAVVLGGAPGRLEARRRVNVMVQDDGLPSGAHAAELVRHVARLRGSPESAGPLIRTWGLSDLGRTTIRRLSGGERRRVSLACALVGTPDFVILDEPTAGLDPRGRALVWESVSALRARGAAVLLCTHLLEEAETLADDIAIISGGRCQAQGPLPELLGDAGESVTFDGPLHLDLDGLVRALPEGSSVREVSPGRYRIDGAASPQTLATVASWCSQHGVQPRNLGVGDERLADLYWRLTEEPGARP